MSVTFDIALAAAVLSAHGKSAWERLEKTVLLGELALDGRVRPVKGALSAVLAAKREGWPAVVVPVDNLAEASLVRQYRGVGCADVAPTAILARRKGTTGRPDRHPIVGAGGVGRPRRCDRPVSCPLRGRRRRRRRPPLDATGPPGVGKTMLAQRLPGLLPPLSHSESLEVTAIHSVAGLLSGSTPLITRPPFVAPHHTSSVASLVGGGTGMARPGAVSRAHRGVLFLECAEIGVSALEALRTPLAIRLARRDGVARYPASFQLVLAYVLANIVRVWRG
jgi:magnesium chelatase family protein